MASGPIGQERGYNMVLPPPPAPQLLVEWKILLKVVEIGEIGLGVRIFWDFMSN